MQSISRFFPLLSSQANIVITCHQKPDGDAMGSTLGLYHFLIQLGHKVTVISPTNWADFLNWMPGVDKVINYDYNRQKSQAIIDEATIIFCLDFNILHRTKNMETPLAKAKCIKVLIDHHEQPQEEAFDYGISLTSKSSTCEMVYDFIVDAGYKDKINLDVAKCLYTGVMTDTGSFRFPSTKASVHLMVAHLKEIGLEHSEIHSNIFDCSLENRLRFTGFALVNRMEVLYQYNTAIFYIYSQDLRQYDIKTGDTEGLGQPRCSRPSRRRRSACASAPTRSARSRGWPPGCTPTAATSRSCTSSPAVMPCACCCRTWTSHCPRCAVSGSRTQQAQRACRTRLGRRRRCRCRPRGSTGRRSRPGQSRPTTSMSSSSFTVPARNTATTVGKIAGKPPSGRSLLPERPGAEPARSAGTVRAAPRNPKSMSPV